MADGRGGEFIKQINTRDREYCKPYVCIIYCKNFNDDTLHSLHWKIQIYLAGLLMPKG